MSEETNKKLHVAKESQTAIYYGVVKGNTIVLPAGALLTEGSTVEVRPVSAQEQYLTENQKEMLFKQRLLELGIINEIRVPRPVGTKKKRRLIQVKGKPLSETIIEERR